MDLLHGQTELRHGPSGLREFEESIRYKAYEVAAVFSADGTLVCRASIGRKRLIGFTDEQVTLMEGHLLTHNHPDLLTNTFSVSDVGFASGARLGEMRVVGESNTYSLRPGGSGWPDPGELERAREELRKDPGFAAWEELNVIAVLINRPVFARDREKICNMLLWERLAAALGLEYRKRYPLWFF
jgi:hypothetical protein